MIFDFFFTIVGYVLATMLSATGNFFALFAFTVPTEIGTNIGLVFGNIWLLNALLPIDHIFVIFSVAIAWKTALFLFDSFLYVLKLINLGKRTFISPFG